MFSASESFSIPSVGGNCSACTLTSYLALLSVLRVFVDLEATLPLTHKDAPANDLHRHSATLLNPKVREGCVQTMTFSLIDTATLCYIRQASLVLVAPARGCLSGQRRFAPSGSKGQRPS